MSQEVDSNLRASRWAAIALMVGEGQSSPPSGYSSSLSNTRRMTGVVVGSPASENHAVKNSLSSAAQRNGESTMSVPATLYERIPTAASFSSTALSFATWAGVV